ncbi:MAG: cytochrome C, partial [Burkholderia sp.]
MNGDPAVQHEGEGEHGVTSVADPHPPRAHDAPAHALPPASHRRAEYGWPAGDGLSATLSVEAGLSAQGTLATWQYRARLASAEGEARSRPVPADAAAADVPLPFVYRHAEARVEVEDPARRIPAHAHAFARESGVDECATALHVDPVELRLRHLDPVGDAGAHEVIRMVTERAQWHAPAAAAAVPASPWLSGRGFAFDGQRPAAPGEHLAIADVSDNEASDASRPLDTRPDWTAWVVDIDVNPATGAIALRRVVAGQGAGEPGEPDAVGPRGAGLAAAQIEAAVARVLGVRHTARSAYDESAGGTALAHELTAAPAGEADAALLAAEFAALDAGERERVERAAAPAAAAIANALYDATGVGFTRAPVRRAAVRRA